jgi:hypothetical protein
MTGQLITLPVRLYVRGLRLALHTAEDLTQFAVEGTLRAAGLIDNLRPGGGREDRGGFDTPLAPPPAPSRPPARRPASAAPQSPTPATDPRIARRTRNEPAPAAAPAPPPRADGNGSPVEELAHERLEREGTAPAIDFDALTREPAHVSEEPVLVREEAERGAEDGAGASVRVQPPWDGYEGMNARAIAARLAGASAAELAAVQLYESTHRGRQSVLQAVERAHKASGR